MLVSAELLQRIRKGSKSAHTANFSNLPRRRRRTLISSWHLLCTAAAAKVSPKKITHNKNYWKKGGEKQHKKWWHSASWEQINWLLLLCSPSNNLDDVFLPSQPHILSGPVITHLVHEAQNEPEIWLLCCCCYHALVLPRCSFFKKEFNLAPLKRCQVLTNYYGAAVTFF